MATVTVSYGMPYEDALDLTAAAVDAYPGKYQAYLAAALAANPPPKGEEAEAAFVAGVQAAFAQQCTVDYNKELLANYRQKLLDTGIAADKAKEAERTQKTDVKVDMVFKE